MKTNLRLGMRIRVYVVLLLVIILYSKSGQLYCAGSKMSLHCVKFRFSFVITFQIKWVHLVSKTYDLKGWCANL